MPRKKVSDAPKIVRKLKIAETNLSDKSPAAKSTSKSPATKSTSKSAAVKSRSKSAVAKSTSKSADAKSTSKSVSAKSTSKSSAAKSTSKSAAAKSTSKSATAKSTSKSAAATSTAKPRVVKKKVVVPKTTPKIVKPRVPRKNNKKNLPIAEAIPKVVLEKVDTEGFSAVKTSKISENLQSKKRKASTSVENIDIKSKSPVKKQKQVFGQEATESIVEVTQFQLIQPKIEPRDYDSGSYTGEQENNQFEYGDLITTKTENFEDYSTSSTQEQYGDSTDENCMHNFTDSKYFSKDCLNIYIKQSPDMDIVEHIPKSDFLANDNSNSQYATLNYHNAFEKHNSNNLSNVSPPQVQSPDSTVQMKKLLDNIKHLLIEFKREKALYKTSSDKDKQQLLITAAVKKLQLEISELRIIARDPANKNLGRPLEILSGFESFLAKNHVSDDDSSSENNFIRKETDNNVSPEKNNIVSRNSKEDEDLRCGNGTSSPNPCISRVRSPSSNIAATIQIDDAYKTSSSEFFNTEKSSRNPEIRSTNVVNQKEKSLKSAIVNVENILLSKEVVDKYNLRAQLSNVQNTLLHRSNIESQAICNTSNLDNSGVPLETSTMEGNYNKKPNKISITIPRITITQDLFKQGNRVVNMGPTKTVSANPLPSTSNFVSKDENFEDESYMSEFDDECSLSGCYWMECYNFSENEEQKIESHDPIFSGATLMHEETIENIRQEINSFQTEDQRIANRNEKTAVQSNNSINLNKVQVLQETQKPEESHFKVPILVPAKRPPTRLKNSKFTTSTPNSSSSNFIDPSEDDERLMSLTVDAYDPTASFIENVKSQTMHGLTQHEDDAISLYADSLQSENINGQDIQFASKPSNVSSTLYNPNVKGDANTNLDVIAKLPSIISTTEKLTNVPSKIVDSEKHQHVIDWITNTTTVNNSRSTINKKSSTPSVFANICYYHFFKSCILKHFQCKSLHHLPSNIRNTIENLQYDDLTSAYNYIRKSSKLYMETIDSFINGFVKLKCDKQLIVMALDVLDLPIFNKTPIVKKYINALENFNLTFFQAIEKIVDENETNIGLSDIILDIICAQSTPSIVENWELVKKLIKNRGDNLIDYGTVKDIMIKSFHERNVQLAKCIINDIISPRNVDLKAIQHDKILKFCRFVSCQIPDYKYVVINQYREFKTINTSKLCCVSFFKDACKFHAPRIQLTKGDYQPVCNANSNLGVSSGSQDAPVDKVVPSDCSVEEEAVVIKTENIKTIDLTYEEVETIKKEPNQGAYLDDSFNSNVDSKDPSVSEGDLKKLSDIISQGNALGFLAKLYDYQDSTHSRWFILNSICFFKVKPPSEIYEMFITVMKGLEQFSSIMKESDLGKMFRTLTVNMIVVLAQDRAYNESAHLLLKFYDELDTLIKVEWFLKTDECDYSEAGKYLHFCKILTRGGLLQEAVDLLRNSDLKLIYKSEIWPMKTCGNRDIELRNRILKEMMLKAIETNISIAKDLILFILMEKDHISELNIWKYFNQLIITMLENGETYKEDLKSMIGNILEGWYNNLSTLALRGLLVILLKDIPENVASSLYHKCSQKNIYQIIKGNETCLMLKTDMADEEIYMTLRVYFEKVARQKYQNTTDLNLQIALPNTHNEKLHLVINNNSVAEFKARTYKILASCFRHAIHIENTGSEPIICIRKDMFQPLFTNITS